MTILRRTTSGSSTGAPGRKALGKKKLAAKKKKPTAVVSRMSPRKLAPRESGAVEKSKAFAAANRKAAKYAKDPKRLKRLIEQATEKGRTVPRGPFGETWAYLMAMFRLLRAYYRKQYTDIPWESLVITVGAVIYFVSPVDFIPDFLPVIGYVDDALVVAWALRAVRGDLDAFMEWEASQ